MIIGLNLNDLGPLPYTELGTLAVWAHCRKVEAEK